MKSAIHFDDFQNVWLPITSASDLEGIHDFWDVITDPAYLSTTAERTKVRGIFERNGVILNRERIDAAVLPQVDTVSFPNKGAIYDSASVTIDSVFGSFMMASPAPVSSRRIQILTDSIPVNAMQGFTKDSSDWVFVDDRLYDELKWTPNAPTTDFNGNVSFGFDLYGALGVSTFSDKQRLEGERYALRVQDRTTNLARASFYPDLGKDTANKPLDSSGKYTSQWLEEVGTLQRTIVDNYAPYIETAIVKHGDDQKYKGSWPSSPNNPPDELGDSSISSSLIGVTSDWNVTINFSEEMYRTQGGVNARIDFGNGEKTADKNGQNSGTWSNRDRKWVVTFDAGEIKGKAASGTAVLVVNGIDLPGNGLDTNPFDIAYRDPNDPSNFKNYDSGPDENHILRIDAVPPVMTDTRIYRTTLNINGDTGTTKNGWFTTTVLILEGTVSETAANDTAFISGIDRIEFLRPADTAGNEAVQTRVLKADAMPPLVGVVLT